MALLERTSHDSYPRDMPAVKTGSGPWGAAVKYWLPRTNMRQADLARKTGIQEKTISSIARGFHTTTKMLEKIAKAFGVALDDVLVSPDSRIAHERRVRLAQEVAERVLRQMEPDQSTPIDTVVSALQEAAAQEEQAQQPRKRKRTTQGRMPEVRRRKKS